MALLTGRAENRVLEETPGMSERLLENAKFVEALPTLPVAFAIGVAIFVAIVFLWMSQNHVPPRLDSSNAES